MIDLFWIGENLKNLVKTIECNMAEIVSAMTISTLVKNYQTKVRDNQFKKVYATLNQAVLLVFFDFIYLMVI